MMYSPFVKFVKYKSSTIKCYTVHHYSRASASELLKLPFFKKAKGKEFIKEVVLGDAPNLQSRAKKVNNHL